MSEPKPSWKIFLENLWGFLCFGKKIYDKGICDKPIKGAYKYEDSCETKGLTKEEASKMMNLSVRQFDRRVKAGLINKGRKYKGDSRLYWDKSYIERVSDTKKK